MRGAPAVMLALALLACGSEEGTTVAEATTQAAEGRGGAKSAAPRARGSTSVTAAHDQDHTAAPDVLGGSGSAPEGATDDADDVIVEEVIEIDALTQEDALAAAREAAEATKDMPPDCTAAYKGLQTIMARFDRQLPANARAGSDTRRNVFMTGCRALPADTQACLVPGYRKSHERECRKELRRVGILRRDDDSRGEREGRGERATRDTVGPTSTGPTNTRERSEGTPPPLPTAR